MENPLEASHSDTASDSELPPESITQNGQMPDGNKQDIREFTKEYAPWARKKLADELKIARLKRDLQSESNGDIEKETSDLTTHFYERFTKVQKDFENESEARDISQIAKKYGVFFVHSIPTKGINKWNTGMNNKAAGQIDNEDTLESNIARIQEHSPDLSCSSVSFEERESPFPSNQVGTMYPFGFVLGRGKVLSAYRFDAGTLYEEGKNHKKSKYDQATQDTSIQGDIEENVDAVLKRKFDRKLNPATGLYEGENDPKRRYNGMHSGRDLDEFIVAQPELDGFYIDLDDERLNTEYNTRALDEINRIVDEYKGIPVYIKEKGKVGIYVYQENGEVAAISDLPAFKGLKRLGDLI